MKKQTDKEPFVSVICTTFNQEAYIKQALDGFVMQQCDFPIEIIVHDDASTDNTATIIKEYAAKYSFIKPIIQSENQYSKGVNIWRELFTKEVRGRYIAICEGDDYWIDPLKLQKQVDFLEKNVEYGLIYSNFIAVNEEGIKIGKGARRRPLHPSGNILHYLAKRNFIQTVTIMGRTTCMIEGIKAIPQNVDFNIIDYAIFFELAALSKVYYLSDVTSAYRVLSESASHSKDAEKKILFAANCEKIVRYYNSKFSLSISDKKMKKKFVLGVLSIYSTYKEKKKFKTFLLRSIQKDPTLLFTPEIYYHLLYVYK